MEAAKRLNYLINEKKMKVYMHDTSSATRAPSVAITYMCLYMKHDNWQNEKLVESYVKSNHNYSTPNMHIVQKTINNNVHIRDTVLKEINDEKIR